MRIVYLPNMSVLGCVITQNIEVCFISVLYQTRPKLPSVHVAGSPMSLMKLHLHLRAAGERVSRVGRWDGHALALRYDHKVRGLLHRNGASNQCKLGYYVCLL